MATEPRIVSNPSIMGGKPVVEGTRITVELILEKLAAGDTPSQITEDYPDLNEESIRVAIRFAADALRLDFVLSDRHGCMNFVADASVAGSLVVLLRQRGHSVTSIRDIRPDIAG